MNVQTEQIIRKNLEQVVREMRYEQHKQRMFPKSRKQQTRALMAGEQFMGAYTLATQLIDWRVAHQMIQEIDAVVKQEIEEAEVQNAAVV